MFINNNRILVKLFQKKSKQQYHFFFMKNSKNNNIILGFSFMYLVSVYPTNRTMHSFFSGVFITAIVVNPPERKLAKRTSVQCSDCDETLCVKCFKAHSRLKLTITHIVTPL